VLGSEKQVFDSQRFAWGLAELVAQSIGLGRYLVQPSDQAQRGERITRGRPR
jgi:hypothetical protein